MNIETLKKEFIAVGIPITGYSHGDIDDQYDAAFVVNDKITIQLHGNEEWSLNYVDDEDFRFYPVRNDVKLLFIDYLKEL